MLPTKTEIEVIKNSLCFQCNKPYRKGNRIRFAYTTELIWWHIKT